MLQSIIIALAPMIAVYGFQASANIAYGDISIVFPGSDSVLHFVGGFATALTGLLLYRIIRATHHAHIAPRILFAGSIIFFTLSVGVLWEWYEFLHDALFQTLMQPTLSDTMKDLLLDTLGAVLFCLMLAAKKYRNSTPGEY